MEWSFGPVVKLFQVLVKCGVHGIIVNIDLWQYVVVSESVHTCWSLCMWGGRVCTLYLCVKARG